MAFSIYSEVAVICVDYYEISETALFSGGLHWDFNPAFCLSLFNLDNYDSKCMPTFSSQNENLH